MELQSGVKIVAQAWFQSMCVSYTSSQHVNKTTKLHKSSSFYC